MKKYFSRSFLVEELLSHRVIKLSIIPLTRLSRLDRMLVFKKGSKVVLSKSCKIQIGPETRKFSLGVIHALRPWEEITKYS